MAIILVVDDEVGIRELLSEILIDEGYDVRLAENARPRAIHDLRRAQCHQRGDCLDAHEDQQDVTARDARRCIDGDDGGKREQKALADRIAGGRRPERGSDAEKWDQQRRPGPGDRGHGLACEHDHAADEVGRGQISKRLHPVEL